jgi:hypothetical protein
MPSATALTTAVPGATAEIIPESFTLAIDALEVYQVTGRSVRGVPFASFGVAIARAVRPAASEEGIVRETDATGAFVVPTSTTEVPYDEQAATAITRPVTASMKVRIGCALFWSVVRRLDWHSVRFYALASGLCVAGFRRVCLCRTPPKRLAILPCYSCKRPSTSMSLLDPYNGSTITQMNRNCANTCVPIG